MRVFQAARRQQPSTLEEWSSALQQYFTVPADMPDAFVKAFARLDSSEHENQDEASTPADRSRSANGCTEN
jgi:hypothetical protein